MPFDRTQPLMEHNLCWKKTFNGRRPLMKDDLWWKTNFDGRRPYLEDNLWGTLNVYMGPWTIEDNIKPWSTNEVIENHKTSLGLLGTILYYKGP